MIKTSILQFKLLISSMLITYSILKKPFHYSKLNGIGPTTTLVLSCHA